MEKLYKNLIIYASPKADSFTGRLLKKTCDYPKEETAFFDCFRANPAPCNGCSFCEKNEGCIMRDLDDFFSCFERAENVTFAFPIYNGSFPAPLKALIDRFQIYYSARFFKKKIPPIKGRRDVTLLITKGSNRDYTDIILEQIKPLFTVTGCSLKKIILLKGTDGLSLKEELNPEIISF